MKKLNYLFVLLAAIFAVLILFVSLQSANKSEMVGSSKVVTSKFYVSKEILPDHSLYPLLMVFDRIRLDLADSDKKVYLFTAYAKRRLFYSQRLLEKGNPGLAFTTLSKAIKYVNQALAESVSLLSQARPNELVNYQEMAFLVLESFEQQTTFLLEHQDQFSNNERALLESLTAESYTLAEKLRSLINQSIKN